MSEARTQLSRVLDQAVGQGPQTITRRGRPIVMVLSVPGFVRRFGRLPQH